MSKSLSKIGLLSCLTVFVVCCFTGCSQPDKKGANLSDQPWGSGYNDSAIPPQLLEGR